MRKHGWQLPYHPLQVVAVAVFLALGFAFYVFFAPFVGKKLYQYIAMGVYTPLIVCVFGLYVWCAAADPADPGVFKSKKYLKTSGKGKDCKSVESKVGGDSVSSLCDPSAPEKGGRSMHQEGKSKDGHAEDSEPESEAAKTSLPCTSWFMGLLVLPFAFLCGCRSPWDESSERHMSEDGMFYCSLCEVEVFKYSKHCRVCDKCVDSFDHHCRWLNNCIGKTNYRRFFTLMIFSLLLLVLQWLTGILVLICCFLDRKRFSVDIVSKLGSSFTIVPFVIVVVVCTILAMLATLPIAQLFFFHILLIKKGISTYDYIIALREQEQQVGGGQQSPQMSQVSSLTGMSSASSFNTFHRGAWCTPPRLFVEDQYDVVPPETASVSSYGKKTTTEEPPPFKKKNPAVKISPWALARLNAEEVSKAAAEARKKSKILQPIARRDKGGSARLPHQLAIPGQDTDSSLGSSGRRMTGMTKLGSSSSRRRNNNGGSNHNKRVIRIPQEIGSHKLGPGSGSSRVLMGRSYGNNSNIAPSIPAKSGIITASSASLVPLRLEGRSTFRSSLQAPMSSSANMMVGSSPESSLDSPDIHPFGVSSSRIEESRRLAGLGVGGGGTSSGTLITGLPRSRSTSDGYEASGGEDSDRVPSSAATNGGGVQGPVNWDSLLLGSGSRDARIMGKVKTSSAGMRKH